MRVDWLPFSASALVVGATALALGALLTPGDGSLDSLRAVVGDDARLLAVSGLLFAAAVALTIGLPSILTLLDAKTGRAGLLAVGVFAVGCLGTAGYAMQLAFFRALVLEDLLRDEGLAPVTQDLGLNLFLITWLGTFYVGEALIALALLRAGTVPRWMPMLLLGHVALFPLVRAVPEIGAFAVLLATVAFTGFGVVANSRHSVRSAA